jgi:hypothetical protein
VRQTLGRVPYLRAAGFDEPTVRHLSDLHTPNPT